MSVYMESTILGDGLKLSTMRVNVLDSCYNCIVWTNRCIFFHMVKTWFYCKITGNKLVLFSHGYGGDLIEPQYVLGYLCHMDDIQGNSVQKKPYESPTLGWCFVVRNDRLTVSIHACLLTLSPTNQNQTKP